MFLKKLKIELTYDPAIQLLGIYSDKTTIQKTDTYNGILLSHKKNEIMSN